jgi:hypothetical protein
MNIQELEDKHAEIIGESDLNFPDWLIPGEDTSVLYEKEEELVAKEATKLSVEFAIEVLDSIFTNGFGCPDKHSSRGDWEEEYKNLKFTLQQYLDEG